MGQAINIYFRNATYDELRQVLDEVAVRTYFPWDEPDTWAYPNATEFYNVVVFYDDLLNGFEDEDIDALIAALGDFPSSIVTIEYKASQGYKTCESAAKLALLLLTKFDGVVDDLHDEYWTLNEITQKARKAHGDFFQATHYSSLVTNRR